MGEEADLDQITDMLEDSGRDKDELAELSSEATEEKSSEEKPQKELYDDPITEDYKTRANNNIGGRAWDQDKEHFKFTILK